MTKPIDLVELRQQIRDGIFQVYMSRNRIYIKDAESDECVMICELKVGEQE